MIKTDHDRLFQEFPAPSTLLVRWDNGWVHLSRRTMPTLCHQHHNDPATHRRDDDWLGACVQWVQFGLARRVCAVGAVSQA